MTYRIEDEVATIKRHLLRPAIGETGPGSSPSGHEYDGSLPATLEELRRVHRSLHPHYWHTGSCEAAHCGWRSAGSGGSTVIAPLVALYRHVCRVCGRRYRSSMPKFIDDAVCAICRRENPRKRLSIGTEPVPDKPDSGGSTT
jgi:hypothetical protein